MANYYNTTCVVQGPRKALLEVQQVFSGFKRDERIFANHPAIMNDKFLWMKFDAKKGLIIKTVSRDVTHESAVVDYICNINEDVEVAFMTAELNTETWYKYDPNGVFDNDPDILIFDDPDVPDADLPETLRESRKLSTGYFYGHKKDLEDADIPGTMHFIVCEDITEGPINNSVKFAMEYGDLTKLEGIKDVRVECTMWALQMYITCDNGDVIQLVYEFGSRKIHAALAGLHCNNDAHIPVCSDEMARKDLIDDLVRYASDIVLSSNPTSCHMELPEYAFRNRGHVVYHLKYVDRDMRRLEPAFKDLVKDVLRKHNDGVLLDIANVKVDHLPKEITEAWVLG